MVYIQGGSVQQKRSPWRLSAIVDFIFGIYTAVVTFFMTMVDPQAAEQFLKKNKKDKPDPPRRGPRIAGLDNIGAGGNAPPPCAGGG